VIRLISECSSVFANGAKYLPIAMAILQFGDSELVNFLRFQPALKPENN